MSFQFPPNAIGSSGFTRGEPLITPEQLKTRYLFGIDLTDKNGNTLPDEVLQHQINSAISYVEHKLDIIIMPTEIVDRHDYRLTDYQNFNFIQLKKRPTMQIKFIKAKFPNNQELIDYPLDWVVLEKETSQLQLAPVNGSFNGLILTNGGYSMPLIFGTRDYWPHMFEITYIAGFCNDQVPIIINEMIGLQASISVFEILRDIVFGPVASESTSVDGASTNRSIVAQGPYGPKIESYTRRLQEYFKVAHKYYNGFSFVVP
jgi:hypothetical protein